MFLTSCCEIRLERVMGNAWNYALEREKRKVVRRGFAVSEAIDATMLWRSLIHPGKEQTVELLLFWTMLPL